MCMTEAKVKEFIHEMQELCKKHRLSISHEDGHGAFLVEEWDEYNHRWLGDAVAVNEDGSVFVFS